LMVHLAPATYYNDIHTTKPKHVINNHYVLLILICYYNKISCAEINYYLFLLLFVSFIHIKNYQRVKLNNNR
jgi:multisubunit Na+/H+ antiporter MnhF subunit